MSLFDLATQDAPEPSQTVDLPRRSIAFDDLPETPSTGRSKRPAFDSAFDAAAKEYGVDSDLLRGVAFAESRFRNDIISGKVKSSTGAMGLMQFMPDTAKQYGINPTDPVEAIFGAAAYLRDSLDKFGGDEQKAVASYNWGANRKAYNSETWKNQLPAETSNYIETVFGFADGQKAKRGTAKELPEGVAPSQAGAGRGVVNPPFAADLPQPVAKVETGIMDKIGNGMNAIRDFATGANRSESGSVLENAAPAPVLPTTSFAPVEPKVREAFNNAYDAASPEQRQAMAQQTGWKGQLAQDRAGIYAKKDAATQGMPLDNGLSKVDPRVESRQSALVAKGEAPQFAERAAREAARAGALPGQEVDFIKGKYGVAGVDASPIATMQAELAAAPAGKKPEGVEVATNAIMRGLHQNASMAAALGAAGAKSLGADDLALGLLQSYFTQTAKAKQYPSQVENFTKIESWSDVPTYALEGILENAQTLVATVGAGAVGGVLARSFGAKAVTGMVAEQAAKELAKRTAIGAAAGAGIAAIGMETGSIYGDIAKDTGQERPGVAASFGLVAGALDAIPAMRAATKILGTEAVSWVGKEVAKRYGKEALVQLGSEGATEFLQTWVEKAAVTHVDGRSLFTKENLIEAIDAGLKGGFSGAAMGVSSQAIGDYRNRGTRQLEQGADSAKENALAKWDAFSQIGKQNSPTAPVAPRVEDQPVTPVVPVAPVAPVTPQVPAVSDSTVAPAVPVVNDAASPQQTVADNVAKIFNKQAEQVSPTLEQALGQQPAGSIADRARASLTENTNVSQPVENDRLDNPSPAIGGNVDAGSGTAGGLLADAARQPSVPVADQSASTGATNTSLGNASAAPAPVVVINNSGTVTIKGDPAIIRQTLQDGGITSMMTGRDGVTVGVSQARQAKALIQDIQPQGKISEPQAPQAVQSQPQKAPQAGQTSLAIQPVNSVAQPSSESLNIEPLASPATNPTIQPSSEQQRTEFARVQKIKADAGARLRGYTHAKSPFLAFLGKHGLNASLKSEFSPDKNPMLSGYGPMFRKTGLSLDALLERAVEDGYLPPGTNDDAKLYELINRQMRGESIAPMYTENVASNTMQDEIDKRRQFEEDNAEELLQNERDEEMLALIADTPLTKDEFPDIIDVMYELGFTAQDIESAYNDDAKNNTERSQYSEIDRGFGETAVSQAPRTDQQADSATQASQSPEAGLTAPTREDILAQQDRATEAEKAKEKADKDAAKVAKNAADKKEIDARQQASADNFQLGQSAEDSLSGQSSMLDAPAEKSQSTPSEAATNTEEVSATTDYSALEKLMVDVTIVNQSTGKNQSVKISADIALKEYDDKIDSLQRLLKCVG